MKETHFNEEAETRVLGSLLKDPAVGMLVCEENGITPNHFLDPRNKKFYEMLQKMAATEGAGRIDLLTFDIFLDKHNMLDAVGGEMRLHEVIDETPTAQHLQYYANSLIDSWGREGIEYLCRDTAKQAKDKEVSTDEIVAKLIERAMRLSSTKEDEGDVWQEMRSRFMKGRDEGGMGLPTRWKSLGNVKGGYQMQMQTILAGGTSSGKTTAALCEALFLAGDLNIPIAIAGLEMGKKMLVTRCLGIMSGVSVFKLLRGTFDDAEMLRMDEAYKVFEKMPIYINDKRMNIGQLSAFYVNQKVKHGVQMAILDYLQLLNQTRGDRRPRNEQVADWSAAGLELAKRLDLHHMALSQFSRRGHKDQTETPPLPTLEVLRDSGAIEQDADTVVIISKKPGREMADYSGGKDWDMVFDVAKNRYGPTGQVEMCFQRSRQMYITKDMWQAHLENM